MAAGRTRPTPRTLTDPDVRRFLWDGDEISREKADGVLERGSRRLRGTASASGACSKPERTSSSVLWSETIDDGPDVELLYAIRPPLWGRGYATEAARAVLRWLPRNAPPRSMRVGSSQRSVLQRHGEARDAVRRNRRTLWRHALLGDRPRGVPAADNVTARRERTRGRDQALGRAGAGGRAAGRVSEIRASGSDGYGRQTSREAFLVPVEVLEGRLGILPAVVAGAESKSTSQSP